MSLGNKLDNENLMFIQRILNLITTLMIIIMLSIMRRK